MQRVKQISPEQTSPEQTRRKKICQFIAGLVSLALFTVWINLAISLKLIFPENIVEWVSSSSEPGLSLWFISAMVASALMILLKTGAKLSFLKLEIQLQNPFFSLVLGLPVEVTTLIFLLSMIALALFQPVCHSPAAVVDVSSLNENALIQYDGDSIYARAGTKLTLKAVPQDNAVTFCSWTSEGSSIMSMVPASSCTTQLHLSDKAGRETITLMLSKSFCSVKSVISLDLIVEPFEEEEE